MRRSRRPSTSTTGLGGRRRGRRLRRHRHRLDRGRPDRIGRGRHDPDPQRRRHRSGRRPVDFSWTGDPSLSRASARPTSPGARRQRHVLLRSPTSRARASPIDTGGVQQAEQRRGRRRSQAVGWRQPARSRRSSDLRGGKDAWLPLAPVCRRLGRACGQHLDAGAMAQGVGYSGPHDADNVVQSPWGQAIERR